MSQNQKSKSPNSARKFPLIKKFLFVTKVEQSDYWAFMVHFWGWVLSFAVATDGLGWYEKDGTQRRGFYRVENFLHFALGKFNLCLRLKP